MSLLSTNLARIHEQIDAACHRAKRDPNQVRLVVVSKTQTAAQVQQVMTLGPMIFGENRVQEARDKIPLVDNPALQWHLIGPLQRNKAKTAVQLFQMIQSVDSLELAQELAKWTSLSTPLPILLQINIGKEPQKSGLLPEQALPMARSIAALPGLSIQGLMAIPPQTERPEQARHWFQAMAQLRQTIEAANIPGLAMKELSMGMSHDYTIAVEEGATLVRIGSAVFN